LAFFNTDLTIFVFIVIVVALILGFYLIKRYKQHGRKHPKATREHQCFMALTGATDGLWDWDLLKETVFYSNQFRKSLGFSPEAFTGTIDFFKNQLHPDERQSIIDALDKHLTSREPFEKECRLQTTSGQYRWFFTRAQAVWDEEGNPIQLAGWIQDITDSKRGQQKLKMAFTEINALKSSLEAEKAYLQGEIKLEFNHENIIGKSDALKDVLHKVEQVAETETHVLILGETGTGKELIARTVHATSKRKDRSLVKINCATLPSNLIESELFGHEKGAFTGAHTRQLGRFEVADGGTLFLDEIGELPLELQPKLLRVIQEGEFERLGSAKTIKVNSRIIAATNRNLEAEVRKGKFREDHYYRLNIFPITVPSLRERSDDIPLLVEFFIHKISKKLGKPINIIPIGVMKNLQRYNWPGNIRELKNVIERAVIHTSGPKLQLANNLESLSKKIDGNRRTLNDVEREYITRVLVETGWKVSGKNSASEILGLNRSTLHARMRKLGITNP
jgi:chemotaxis protein methyltransferase CheR